MMTCNFYDMTGRRYQGLPLGFPANENVRDKFSFLFRKLFYENESCEKMQKIFRENLGLS